MISKVLEARVFLNNNQVPLTNTEFDISIDWDCVLNKKEDYFEILIKVHRVFGKFNYREKRNEVKRHIEVEFESNSEWKQTIVEKKNINFSRLPHSVLFPEFVDINLDEQTLKVCF